MRYILSMMIAFQIWSQQTVAPPSEVPEVESKLFWKYHHLAAVGYRRDRQQFQDSNSRIRIFDRNTMELILRSHLEIGHFVGYVQGSYGWLMSGHYDYSATGDQFSEPLSFGKFDLGAGYTADAMGALGIHFKLIKGPNLEISFMPFGGYKYSHLMNFPEGEDRFEIPSPPVLLGLGTSGFALGRFPSPNQQDWFGPYAEGQLRLLFWQQLEWTLFYQYHRPALRSKLKEEIDLYLFDPSTNAIAIDLFRTTSIYRVRDAIKQLGGTNLRYHGSSGWNFGIHFEGSSTWSHKARHIAKRTKEQYILPPIGTSATSIDTKASIHWTSYEFLLYLGYQF